MSFVIIYHFFVLLNLYDHALFPYIHSFGIFGVSLFFIISGYLIYRSIDYSITHNGTKRGLKKYALHRLFRILPAYYFNFMIVLIMASFVIGSSYFYSFDFFKQILSHLSFTSYFIYKDAGLTINGAYWTLSIEMLWYLVAPLFFIYIKKDRYLIILFLMGITYLMGLDFALYDTFLNLDKSNPNYMLILYYWSFQLPGQIIYFISGILIYKYVKNQYIIPMYVKSLLSILLITILIYISSSYNLNTSFTKNNIFILFIVVSLFILLYNTKLKFMLGLEWIGKISYSLYLWHMPLLYVMKKTEILTYLPLSMVVIIFTGCLLIFSSFSYYFIEEGGFRLRKRLEEKGNK